MPSDEQSNIAMYTFQAGKLSVEDLLVIRLEGQESISRLFHYRLLLASSNFEIEPAALIGQSGMISMANLHDDDQGHPDDKSVARYVNGIVSRFEHLRDGTSLSYYEVDLVPAVWLLTFRRRSRIFQKMTVQEIVTKILKDSGVQDKTYQFSLSGAYPKREFCVQYRESEWNFIQRLLEEEGIYYFFKQEKSGHTLVLGDTPQVHLPIVGEPKIPYLSPSMLVSPEPVNEFRLSEEIRTGKVTLRDFEFTKPVPAVEAASEAKANTELELYDYPAQYISDDKKIASETTRLGKTRLEELRTTQVSGLGRTVCRRFAAGSTFELTDHSREAYNQTYLIVSQHVVGSQPEAAQDEVVGESERAEPLYESKFRCIPQKTPFRPTRVTHKPVVQGSQTAIVVGPAGEEIYTDEHGRIKVHFHWDREGKFDENDSCWVRVSQGWAGGQYGSFFLPRIGQEVIVDFIEGNPDDPIVTGRVYNGDHKPPYKLPDEKTKSTIRTNSSLDGSGANELRFEDKKGSEQIFLHSQKDLHVRALNDRVTNIGAKGEGNSHETIEKEYRQLVKDNRSRKVDKMEAIEIAQTRNIKVGGDVLEDYGGDQKKIVASNYHLTVGGKEALKIGGSFNADVGGDVLEKFGMNQKTDVGMDYHLKGGMNVVVEAGIGLTLKAGGGEIVIDPSGVTIKGNTVTVDGTLVKINSGPGSPATPFQKPSPAAAEKPSVAAPAEPEEADGESPGADVSYSGGEVTYKKVKVKELKPAKKEEKEEAKKKTWLKLKLVDEEGNAVPGEPYQVTAGDGRVFKGNLDVNGEKTIKGLDEGEQYEVTFPELDEDEWEKG